MARTNGIEIKGITQLDRVGSWATDGLEAAILTRRSMSPFIHAFGRGVSSMFDMEVSPNGRSWQGLADFTNDKREERGYSSVRPIMEQSGQLRQAAVEPFLKWGAQTGRSQRSYNAPYGNHHNIKMVASNNLGRFHAVISGPRVQNQYGGNIRKPTGYYAGPKNTRGIKLPARPFWGITVPMIFDGMGPFHWILYDEWRKQAKGLHVL